MTSSAPSHPRLPWWELALGTALCSVVAWLNGFPLIYSDTGTYLRSAHHLGVPVDRPIFYGLFLRLFHAFDSVWAPALGQAAIGAFLVGLVLMRTGLSRSGHRLGVLAVLVATTGLSRFAGQLMADVFLAYFVLALYLLACHGASLAPGERAAVVGILMVSVLVHSSHLAIAMGLMVALGLVAWGLRRRGVRGVVRLGAPALALAAVLVTWPTVNKLLTGEAFFSRSGHIFITARLINDGIIQELLAQRCGVERYVLCDHQAELKGMNSDTFLFLNTPPFHAVGGWEGSPEPAMHMVKHSLRYLPWMHVKKAVRNLGRQLDAYDLGDGLHAYGSWMSVVPTLAQLHPTDVPAFERSQQQKGHLLEMLQRHRPVNRGVGLLSLVLLPVLAVLAFRRGVETRTVLLPVVVALALLANAGATALLAGVFHRYQARAMWLPVLTCLVLAHQLWAGRRAARSGGATLGQGPSSVPLPAAPARAGLGG